MEHQENSSDLMDVQSTTQNNVDVDGQSHDPKEVLQASDSSASQQDNQSQTAGAAAENENQIAECCKALADQMNERYLRLLAEFDNYRKRMLKEREELMKSASIRLIKDILQIVDDMERAIATANDEDKKTHLYEGVELILKKLKTTLESYGLEPISGEGDDFNTDIHEALTAVEVEQEQKGKVIQVVQKGYKVYGQVIRHAKVIVGK